MLGEDLQNSESDLLGTVSKRPDMDQQGIEGGNLQNESDNKPNQKTIKWGHVFDWGFWTSSPIASIVVFFIGGILLSSITNFPGGNPKQVWYVAGGAWLVIGVIIFWVASGIIARMEGRELLTQREIEEREQTYKEGIQTQLNTLGTNIAETQRRLAEQQRRRRLTAPQKEAIKQAIAPFAGQKITVFYPIGDAEASQYAGDFAVVFREAGWECGDIRGSFFPADFENTVAAASKALEKQENQGVVPPNALYPLVKILMELGLSDNRGLDPLKKINSLDDVKDDELGLRIGTKLPPSTDN